MARCRAASVSGSSGTAQSSPTISAAPAADRGLIVNDMATVSSGGAALLVHPSSQGWKPCQRALGWGDRKRRRRTWAAPLPPFARPGRREAADQQEQAEH